MRRDLPLDVDPAALVLAPPDRSQLKEIFRRFEFRNLLGRVDDLDEALPAAAVEVTGVDVPWREGELEQVAGPTALAVAGDRFALARAGEEVVVGNWIPKARHGCATPPWSSTTPRRRGSRRTTTRSSWRT